MKQRFFSDFLTETIKNDKFGIEVRYSPERLTAIMYRGKSTKPYFHYKFKDREQMLNYIDKSIKTVVENENRKLAIKEARKLADSQVTAEEFYQVGDIVYNSWGWEQTNVDFFQVVSMTNKTIKVQSICAATVPGSEGFMCDRVKPLKDQFKTERSETYNLKVKAGGHLANPASYYNFQKVSENEKTFYRSWYA